MWHCHVLTSCNLPRGMGDLPVLGPVRGQWFNDWSRGTDHLANVLVGMHPRHDAIHWVNGSMEHAQGSIPGIN